MKGRRKKIELVFKKASKPCTELKSNRKKIAGNFC
jgi:hypothetical protein